MPEKTMPLEDSQTLRALELKNKLLECLISPACFNKDLASRYYLELCQADSEGEILNSSLIKLYEEKMGEENRKSEAISGWTIPQIKKKKRKLWRKIGASCVVFLLLIFVLSFPKIEVALLRMDASVPLPLRFVDMADKKEQDWSKYRKTLKIACDDLNMKIKFPTWLPPGMECASVTESTMDHANSMRVDFIDKTKREEYPDGRAVQPFIWISIQKMFVESPEGGQGMRMGLWDPGTHYTVEHINGRDYYIGADLKGTGYVVIMIEGQYVYTIGNTCDYQTTLRVIQSIRWL